MEGNVLQLSQEKYIDSLFEEETFYRERKIYTPLSRDIVQSMKTPKHPLIYPIP
eukprot:m.120883 g.120883  ORF g.120883 m.120883 type:complete len:54 (+) comp9375_c0_seq11:1504-1665(+)